MSYSKEAANDLAILKQTHEVPSELEDELLAALAGVYERHDAGDPRPARDAVKIIERFKVKE